MIAVVDNNDRLYDRLRQAVSGVTVIQNSGPPGLSGARNTGIAATDAPIVAFLDDDAIAPPTWLAELAAPYAGRPEVIGVGGGVVPRWTSPPPHWLPEEFGWTIGCSYRGQPTRLAPVRNLIGANMSFRRWALLAVGGFNPNIGQVGSGMLRGDDTEVCIRLSKQLPRTVILYQPTAVVAHTVTPERATWRYFLHRCYTEGLMKAQLVRMSGIVRGLASERRQALTVLPSGVVRHLLGITGPGGVSRAAAIVAGFTITAVGYLQGRIGLVP
ncbi:MAG: hypothetical protein KatS3mg060_2806 [Dehalococcoidia bacterium]|nr:MAG: hypothetical protein KatS3mg060_2806 [Dehalococcoidia bacterium]